MPEPEQIIAEEIPVEIETSEEETESEIKLGKKKK